MKSNVYVCVDSSGRNFTDALRFGDLVFVTSSDLNALESSPRNAQVTSEIVRKLATFTEDDYLLLVGSPVLIGVCFHVAAINLGDAGKIKLLQWDRQSTCYVPLSVSLGRLTRTAAA
jgi:hypothetical protein